MKASSISNSQSIQSSTFPVLKVGFEQDVTNPDSVYLFFDNTQYAVMLDKRNPLNVGKRNIDLGFSGGTASNLKDFGGQITLAN